MKVLYFSHVGFADNNFTLYKALREKGIDVTYMMDLSPHWKKSPVFNIVKYIYKDAILPAFAYPELEAYSKYMNLDQCYVLNHKKDKSFSWSAFKTTFLLIKHILKGKYDVIHITHPLWASQMLLYIFRKKLLLTIHDPFPHTGETTKQKNFAKKWALKLTPHFILLNERQKEEFINVYNLKSEQVFINKLGAFDFLHTFEDRNILTDKNCVLFFGRISPYKGIEYLCKAMTIVHKQLPDAYLVIAGGGKIYFDFTPFEKIPYIRLVNRFIEIPEISRNLQKCAVAVCPYTDATQSGVVLMTQTMKKPIIASNVGGLGEMIDDGKTGILVPEKDVEALAKAIIKILSDDLYRSNMERYISDNCFIGKTSWDYISDTAINIYKYVSNYAKG